jgi:UDP-glucose 4-epimerase
MHNVLLTGYTGFVGAHLLNKLDLGYKVSLLGRKQPENLDHDFYRGELNSKPDFRVALASIKTVIHCAARAHIMNDDSQDPLAEFREVNTYGTLNLAKQAASLGVKRFIFISSIKVNGESTENDTRFSPRDKHKPEDPYGISKAEAEEGLLEIVKETGMEVVIIRPTLVYGPEVKGNFLNLLKLSKLPTPLPFGLVNNKRSMIYLDNLVDLIVTCIDHPNAANRVFLASDGDDLSLARLFTLIRQAMNKYSLLLPIPVFLFNLMGRLTGKTAVVDRLIGDLQVDSSDAKKYLDWSAPYTVGQGIKATVDVFLNKSAR